jgi:hypothetical protein
VKRSLAEAGFAGCSKTGAAQTRQIVHPSREVVAAAI